MSILDLKSLESVSYSKDCQHIESDRKYLYLGRDYQICLSFELPPYSCIKKLLQAKLILFKIPTPCEEEPIKSDSPFYSVYPLLDYFSVFNCMYEPPAFDYDMGKFFEDSESCCYTEADVSCIVRAWIDDKIENRGLFLASKRNSRLITYASDTYEIIGMRPMLRLTYEKSICEPLSSVPCVVKID